ncbi:glucose PTS transporter subunit EIIB [Paenibacillus melissococcoides]|uniref:Glucose PTS transporter subunit EIIB n=1 Tax=Paenibacillus melissococcoides TaxID=2912268 RepID=A0ABN8UD50_9BACL|nr:glucose PTS transporter subunit EIIB [Paenibacillus melissococcoides]MEB9892928.1 glucose PTS transporter subunit EIIB [Bacillus cereus]CAH8249097.1 glucose PTS transporter subunit EIIB [Paenibacillus melissococcoides]
MVPVIGAVWFCLYYFTFRFLIVKFNLKTPGREEEAEGGAAKDGEASTEEASAGEARAKAVVQALGGQDNIKDLDCCATRLRVSVFQVDGVQEDKLKETGAKAVIVKGNGVQVIYGPQVTIIKNEIEEYMGES